MADMSARRKAVGAMPRSPSRYYGAAPPQDRNKYAPPQYAMSAVGGGTARYGRERVNSRDSVYSTASAPASAPSRSTSSKVEIKSGMTVEDLKRLTQQRMQKHVGQDPGLHRAPAAAPSALPVTPVTGPSAAPSFPKTGMSVQELKQLTSLRLASQNVMQQTEITGLVSKAVLSNAAKSHYRETLRAPLSSSNGPSSSRPAGLPVVRPTIHATVTSPPPSMDREMMDAMMRHSMPSRPPMAVDFAADEASNQQRYSLPGPGDYSPFDGTYSSSSASDSFSQRSYEEEPEEPPPRSGNGQANRFSFQEDSFPPPPPLDEHGGFVATSVPSWSPPPPRAKNLDAVAPPVPFYSQQPAFDLHPPSRDDGERDQNAIIAPPPGLARRPSMTVPWQVAEAVLNTPQTATNRKTLGSPSTQQRKQLEISDLLQHSSRQAGTATADNTGSDSGFRFRPIPKSGNGAAAGTPTLTIQPIGGRRGSFGNAAEFFKFRRRSKSRLELARDLAAAGEAANGFPNYGATNAAAASVMPGIDEHQADFLDDASLLNNAETTSNASNEGSVDSEVYNVEDPSQLNEYEDSEGSDAYGSFYNATSVGSLHGRDALNSFSNLSILPPPPPPPMMDEEEEGSSASSTSKPSLPMMSPNGARLRKVAEMARRGSLSKEDKTRAKDEIIQSSLGLGGNATQAARMLSLKASTPQPDRPPVSPSMPAPPPGFSHIGSTPTPKSSSVPKNPPSGGIVRPTSSSITSRSPSGSITQDSNGSSQLPSFGSVEERLAAAAQRIADCARCGDMEGMQQAMADMDRLRSEPNAKLLHG